MTHHHHQSLSSSVFVDHVVDYYAIVGIGDTLEWGSGGNDGSSCMNNTSNNNNNNNSFNSSSGIHQQLGDDENDHMVNNNANGQSRYVHIEEERFLREIIYLQWNNITTTNNNNTNISTSDSKCNQEHWTTVYKMKQQQQQQNQHYPNDRDVATFTITDFSTTSWHLSYQQRKQYCNNSNNEYPTKHLQQFQQQYNIDEVEQEVWNRMHIMSNIPAISDVQLYYVQLHMDTIIPHTYNEYNNPPEEECSNPTTTTTASQAHKKQSTTMKSSSIHDLFWKRCATADSITKNVIDTVQQRQNIGNPVTATTTSTAMSDYNRNFSSYERERGGEGYVLLESLLTLPASFDEWCIPPIYQHIYHPESILQKQQSTLSMSVMENKYKDDCYPKLVPYHQPPNATVGSTDISHYYCYVPVLAIRRQLVTDEQRYYEDAAITDIRISMNEYNSQVTHDHHNQYKYGPNSNHYDDGDDDDFDMEMNPSNVNNAVNHSLGQTKWIQTTSLRTEQTTANSAVQYVSTHELQPMIYIRRNRPNGLCDRAFTTRVIGRFPYDNYSNVPLPMEEIPMFCYPKMGCTLYRTQHINCPVPQYYGFVVKNERGENIYVSCLSFMEPLTTKKLKQLEQLSHQRRYVSLPHYNQFIQNMKRTNTDYDLHTEYKTMNDGSQYNEAYGTNSCLVTAFTDITTFENKTICLIGRYPYWTASRKFLSHLHTMATGSVPSNIPIERYISHLLLSVQLPKPGGPSVIIPLPAFNTPMIISMPHEKDFPLLDLPYHRLFSCLSIKTIVTIVLGLLSLERKVIIISTRPSLVLDVAELLRSLLFPFDLCAPYVPRLTEPFKSSLDFPGAIFVGIHDDNDPNGLAAFVRANYPEESTVIDLDTGEVDCDGDRYEVLTSLWNLIPHGPRNALQTELETLCRDADIVDGKEPLDSLFDSAFYVDLTDAVDGNDTNNESKKQLDDRCVRDAFLRFYCSILGGYERYLVVPDANFLISGDEWFDAPGFVASAPTANASYVTSLVSTQLFQSFIQRRTEASDIHCMLFDECVTEYHSTSIPYGRTGGDVEIIRTDESSQPQILYSLLVDQSATLVNPGFDPTNIAINRSMDASEADSSFTMNMSRAVGSVAETSVMNSESVVSYTGDIVTVPSTQNLPPGRKYIYCLDGNPSFPHDLNPDLFLPREPLSWTIALTKAPDPLLARSGRELEEANRRRRVALSHLGVTQRRCLWQLPKLMASHFLGSWLLCMPALVSQLHLSHYQQSKYLQRALGALRILRSRQRIVPDEAAYRALIVACGRTQSDRRVELVKLFGLLRSDGIFPSAVTLGQYTKAIAEGYSKRQMETYQTEDFGFEVTAVRGSTDIISNEQRLFDLEVALNNLDASLYSLEYHGGRWRQWSGVKKTVSVDNGDEPGIDAKVKRIDSRIWHPVVYSSSFVPFSPERISDYCNTIRLVAIWSRTQNCANCSYVPLEDEVQAGWDAFVGKNDIPGAIGCPRCDAAIVPLLGYREFTIEECLQTNQNATQGNSFSAPGIDFKELPPQIRPNVEAGSASHGENYVTYICPSVLREALEHYVEEYGDGILDRDQLRDLDPEVFYNFWWYCARFSLPLPLPTSLDGIHLCAFAAWDRSTAERGCYSAAKVIQPILQPLLNSETNDQYLTTASEDPTQTESYDDFPLLSRFNLQGFYSNVWDHPDLSKLLVSLVEACDKRDFKDVVEKAIQCNRKRIDTFAILPNITNDDSQYGTINSLISESVGTTHTAEFDVYRVILYLAKYQCTSAFHNFFPTMLKPCKGYHYWCAVGTPLPTFDRLFRDAVRRLQKSGNIDKSAIKAHDVSDVALAFRCVFGHLV